MDLILRHGLEHAAGDCYFATLVHAPVVTPWGDRNARVQDPDGMQITLFEEKAAG